MGVPVKDYPNYLAECAKGKRPSANGYVWRYEGRNDLSEYRF